MSLAKNIYAYQTKTFIFSFTIMNAKTIYWSIAISIICIGAGVSYKYYNAQPTETVAPQCTIENPVWCEEQIEKLRIEYVKYSEIQSRLSRTADAYRAIQKLWTGETEKLSEPNQ